jgi:GNAT superfamily N-acetyltransferase
MFEDVENTQAQASAGLRLYRPADFAQVLELYSAVGWTTYAKAPAVLERALAGSATVVIATGVVATGTAAADGERVVGLARVVSDGETICYLRDVLVHPSVQRMGLGMRLVGVVLEPYAKVRQKVLLTDDGWGQRAFYQALGYSSFEGTRLRDFTRLDEVWSCAAVHERRPGAPGYRRVASVIRAPASPSGQVRTIWAGLPARIDRTPHVMRAGVASAG